MGKKAVSGMMLTLLLIGMLMLAFNIQVAGASGTIYIRADGSVDPPTAPISSVDNVTYTFTADIYDSIVVERDDIVVDGAGYTVQGAGSWAGIDLSYRNNVTLKNVEVTNFDRGIDLYHSSNNTLSGNTASNNLVGIFLLDSSNNVLFLNNLIDNTIQASVTTGYVNTWDNGYPSGGNYWSDYAGVDFYSGPYQNMTGSDGIGDTSYTVSGLKDNYPLMNPMSSLQPPIAIFTYIPEYPVVDEIATFNATSSYDRDGSIISYEWNFGDGNITTVTTPIIMHVYTAQDTYTVNLTVTDNDGLSHSTTKTIIVDSTPPTIETPSRVPDGDVLPDQSVKVSVNVTDAVSGVKNVTLSYTINNGTTWENLPMNYNASTGLYEATIPRQQADTWVKHKIVAYDNAENPATKDGTEPYFTYQVIPEFPSATILPILIILTLLALVLAKRRFPRKTDT